VDGCKPLPVGKTMWVIRLSVNTAVQGAIELPAPQGLTLVHISAQRMHILWDTSGASFPPSPLDRGTRGGVTRTAKVELKTGRV
jgi:hypothetical protein